MTTSQDGDGGGGNQRSNILSRISKMGQSMLPSGTPPGPGSATSEDDMVRNIVMWHCGGGGGGGGGVECW